MKKIIIPIACLCLLAACTPSSKKQTDASGVQTEASSTDSIQVLHGQLIMGHEAYSFTVDEDSATYWIVDKSERLKKQYEAALPPEAEPYTPVPARLKVLLKGPSTEGLAADYDGVIEVLDILSVGE